jgi:hypothetical protein
MLPPKGDEKEAEVRTSASLIYILIINYRLLPYGLLNLKNICGAVDMMFV